MGQTLRLAGLPSRSISACARGTAQKLDDNEAIEFTGFVDALSAVEHAHDFIVVDTAGSDNHMTRLAHSMADTLITPLNDSFVDFAVLGTVDPASYCVSGESHYARLVREARQQRRLVDGAADGLGGRPQPDVDAGVRATSSASSKA